MPSIGAGLPHGAGHEPQEHLGGGHPQLGLPKEDVAQAFRRILETTLLKDGPAPEVEDVVPAGDPLHLGRILEPAQVDPQDQALRGALCNALPKLIQIPPGGFDLPAVVFHDRFVHRADAVPHLHRLLERLVGQGQHHLRHLLIFLPGQIGNDHLPFPHHPGPGGEGAILLRRRREADREARFLERLRHDRKRPDDVVLGFALRRGLREPLPIRPADDVDHDLDFLGRPVPLGHPGPQDFQVFPECVLLGHQGIDLREAGIAVHQEKDLKQVENHREARVLPERIRGIFAVAGRGEHRLVEGAGDDDRRQVRSVQRVVAEGAFSPPSDVRRHSRLECLQGSLVIDTELRAPPGQFGQRQETSRRSVERIPEEPPDDGAPDRIPLGGMQRRHVRPGHGPAPERRLPGAPSTKLPGPDQAAPIHVGILGLAVPRVGRQRVVHVADHGTHPGILVSFLEDRHPLFADLGQPFPPGFLFQHLFEACEVGMDPVVSDRLQGPAQVADEVIALNLIEPKGLEIGPPNPQDSSQRLLEPGIGHSIRGLVDEVPEIGPLGIGPAMGRLDPKLLPLIAEGLQEVLHQEAAFRRRNGGHAQNRGHQVPGQLLGPTVAHPDGFQSAMEEVHGPGIARGGGGPAELVLQDLRPDLLEVLGFGSCRFQGGPSVLDHQPHQDLLGFSELTSPGCQDDDRVRGHIAPALGLPRRIVHLFGLRLLAQGHRQRLKVAFPEFLDHPGFQAPPNPLDGGLQVGTGGHERSGPFPGNRRFTQQSIQGPADQIEVAAQLGAVGLRLFLVLALGIVPQEPLHEGIHLRIGFSLLGHLHLLVLEFPQPHLARSPGIPVLVDPTGGPLLGRGIPSDLVPADRVCLQGVLHGKGRTGDHRVNGHCVDGPEDPAGGRLILPAHPDPSQEIVQGTAQRIDHR